MTEEEGLVQEVRAEEEEETDSDEVEAKKGKELRRQRCVRYDEEG